MAKKNNATFGGSRRGYENTRGKAVGDNYPADRFNNPVDAGMSTPFGSHDEKDVFSDNSTTFEGGGAKLRKGAYDELWEGK
jgi:hypothetical protein